MGSAFGGSYISNISQVSQTVINSLGGGAMTNVATKTGDGNVTTLTWSALPSTYSRYMVLGTIRAADGGGSYCDVQINFNGDTTDANYANQLFRCYGTTTAADTGDARHVGCGASSAEAANIVGFYALEIDNTTGQYHAYYARSGVYSRLMGNCGIWKNTAKITSITLGLYGAKISAQTNLILYGIV